MRTGTRSAGDLGMDGMSADGPAWGSEEADRSNGGSSSGCCSWREMMIRLL